MEEIRPTLLRFLFTGLGLYVAILVGLYFGQEKLLFFPEKLDRDFEFHFGPNTKEFFIPSGDIELHALGFEVEYPKGLLFYFHGNAGSLASWGHVALQFAQSNYNIYVLDYRGYGKSGGKITSETQLQRDAETFHNFFRARYPKLDTVIFGRSIGTGIASWLATVHAPKKLILETPYFNLPDLATSIYPFVPKALVRYKLRNDHWLAKVKCPVHLIHGTRDALIPVEASHRLSKINSKFSLHIIKDGGHNNLSDFADYRTTLQKIFLDQ